MIIDGVEYEPVNRGVERLEIVVLDRGFVVVGKVTVSDHWLTIRDCNCVRKWGTAKGLGELAANGPLNNTVLDGQPTTRVHELQVVQRIECEDAKWIR